MKLIKIIIPSILFTINIFSQTVWREAGFDDFKDGKFLDAGSNAYVSAKGRIQIITRWDFNNDGFLDIFLPGSHGQTEKENTYIYLNKGNDIDGRTRIDLPGGGSRDGLVADFNKDGFNDLAVVNFKDSHHPKVPVWIYYGSEKGHSPYNRIELPAAEGTSVASGDFNGDSWIDLVVGCQFWEENEDETAPRKSFIYWNSPKGFDPNRKLTLAFNGLGASALASKDIDGDLVEDLILATKEKIYVMLSSNDSFSDVNRADRLDLKGNALALGDVNNDHIYDLAVCTKDGVLVLYGIGNGKFDLTKSILLKVSKAADVALSDLNLDGFDDVIVANLSSAEGAVWIDSYIFYSDGKNFNSKKAVPLPTLGAAGVSCGDLNNDGFPEIIFSNMRITNQQNLLSYIYWNDKGNFFFENHTQLPTQGSMANTIGDLNNDGKPDVIFFNDEGYFRDGPTLSHIYWGNGTRNYSISRSTEFNTHQIFGFGHADLDDDGNVDLIMAQQNFLAYVSHEQAGMIIQWNKDGKFQTPTFLTMQLGYGGVRIADINRDGYLDILGSGRCVDLTDPNKHGFPIFWGSAEGFSFKNRQVLHFTGPRIRGPLLMDLNKDGWLDIVGQVEDGKVKFWWGNIDGFTDERISEIELGRKDHLMYIKGADINNDGWLDLLLPHRGAPDGSLNSSFIYYGSENGYNNSNRFEISTYVPYQNTFSDINKDGWLDLFITSYGGEVSGNRPALIYWGSKNGFESKPTKIETYGSSGSEILDYDGDGWLDILVSNHRKSGSYFDPEPHRHVCPSLLYWGGPDGFSEGNRLELTAVGTSGLNLRDAGNSYDRGLYEDYYSSIYEVPKGEIPSKILWNAETPFGTKVSFQIRSADRSSELDKAEWIGADGKNSWFTESGSTIKNIKGKLIQYRVRLITPNGAATPYLTAVEISFSKK
jgi:hypothetical protein